jgi:beta-N-acetylhexosaminidase
MPASLSSELQVDLLRGELGFEGVIVSDAAPMVGIASRVDAEEEALQNILTGSDVFLFADPIEDFQRLLYAHREGRLTEDMIDEKVRRILALKARLGLEPDTTDEDTGVRGEDTGVIRANTESASAVAARVAEASVTIHKGDDVIPAVLEPAARVATVTVTNPERKPAPDLSVVDSELRSRGFEVEHWENPSHREIMERIEHVDHLFLNIAVSSHTWMGTSRLIGAAAMTFWRGWWVSHPGKVTVTSFGSPYHLYEIPSLPNMVLCYGDAPACQRAAVRVWLGEIAAGGSCPVTLP